jgi:hypothetical protein
MAIPLHQEIDLLFLLPSGKPLFHYSTPSSTDKTPAAELAAITHTLIHLAQQTAGAEIHEIQSKTHNFVVADWGNKTRSQKDGGGKAVAACKASTNIKTVKAGFGCKIDDEDV